MLRIIVICKYCKTSFFENRSKRRIYCSKKCYDHCRKNRPAWNKGLTKETDKRVARYGQSGSKTKKENHHLYIGINNSQWKGGKSKHTEGYICIRKTDHPFCDSRGYVFEHRLAMEKKIGRFLTKQERVHHINGIKNDNRIENLILFHNESLHQKHHNKTRY